MAMKREMKPDWNRKLYKFLKKANALNQALKDPGYGLQLDIQEDVDNLIYEEVDKIQTNPISCLMKYLILSLKS